MLGFGEVVTCAQGVLDTEIHSNPVNLGTATSSEGVDFMLAVVIKLYPRMLATPFAISI